MSHQSDYLIELDPEIAVALRNWLVTLSQRLGLDAAAAAEAPMPPTAVDPEKIAPYLGELAFLLDANGCADPTTATVRISVDSESAADVGLGPVVDSRLNMLDDRGEAPDATPTLDDAFGSARDSGVQPDGTPNRDDGSRPVSDSHVPPEYDPRDYDPEFHAPLDVATWRTTPLLSSTSWGSAASSDASSMDGEPDASGSEDNSTDTDHSQ